MHFLAGTGSCITFWRCNDDIHHEIYEIMQIYMNEPGLYTGE